MGFGIVICYIFLPHCALSIYTTQFGLVFAFSWLISYQLSFCSVLQTLKIHKSPEALKENPYIFLVCLLASFTLSFIVYSLSYKNNNSFLTSNIKVY